MNLEEYLTKLNADTKEMVSVPKIWLEVLSSAAKRTDKAYDVMTSPDSTEKESLYFMRKTVDLVGHALVTDLFLGIYERISNISNIRENGRDDFPCE